MVVSILYHATYLLLANYFQSGFKIVFQVIYMGWVAGEEFRFVFIEIKIYRGVQSFYLPLRPYKTSYINGSILVDTGH